MTVPENLSEPIDEFEIQLGFDPLFYDKKEREFDIVFNIKIKNNDSSFLMESKAYAKFVTNIPISEEFKNSSFAKVNAPAIAFPYLRAYISTVTLNSGMQPIVLPAYNFTNVKIDNKESDSK
ncbi:MAG: protein-export chaperone SecB [Cyclobacteriaceae bacterium]|nr:protein-export chaperone SecB [Cyclobacteriaceae bacterium]